MASSNDLIKYFTEQIVRYLDTPKQSRAKKIKEPITYQWFGFMPLAIKMILHRIDVLTRRVLRLLLVGCHFLIIKMKAIYAANKK